MKGGGGGGGEGYDLWKAENVLTMRSMLLIIAFPLKIRTKCYFFPKMQSEKKREERNKKIEF